MIPAIGRREQCRGHGQALAPVEAGRSAGQGIAFEHEARHHSIRCRWPGT